MTQKPRSNDERIVQIDERRPFRLYIRMEFTAIILAAGKGNRMRSSLAKPLHKVGGHPCWAGQSTLRLQLARRES